QSLLLGVSTAIRDERLQNKQALAAEEAELHDDSGVPAAPCVRLRHLFLLFSEAERIPGGRGSTHISHGTINNQPIRSIGQVAIPVGQKEKLYFTVGPEAYVRVVRPAVPLVPCDGSIEPVFLRKLGWFKPVENWEPKIETSRDGEPIFVPEDMAPDPFADPFLDPSMMMVEEVEGMGRDGEPTEEVDDSISQEELEEAIRKFQAENNLTVTGQLDEETLNKMNEPRCGNPDHTLAKNRTTLGDLLKGAANRSRGNTSSNDTSNAAEEASAGNVRRRRTLLDTWKERQQHRTKDKRGYFTDGHITWRLLQEGYSSQLEVETQYKVLHRSLRMWSEVIPVMFKEDLHSSANEVDIIIAFGRDRSYGGAHNRKYLTFAYLANSTAIVDISGSSYTKRHLHLGCSHEFQGQEYAHAFSNAHASVHLNDDVPWTPDAGQRGVNLLKVALHEVGHTLGLGHQLRSNSLMQPNYPSDDLSLEIGPEDRRAIQDLGYGKCEERFDTVFDWVRPMFENGYMLGATYNTYFFSDGRYWMYENSKGRTRYGDPRITGAGWEGIAPRKLDGILHVWKRSWDALFFFSGDSYYQYDSEEDHVYTHDANGNPFPNLISYGFPGIPDNIDTVYYNRTTGYIYFFQGNLVYQYEIERHRVSPGFPKEISEVFPGAPNDMDAAYYSYAHGTTFFIKGLEYWKIAYPNGPIVGPMKTNEQWQDICNVWMRHLDY
ncbi:determination of heart left/right asymmetry, partial [Branchiostoma belcheri]